MKKKKVVITYGTFDIFHYGHLQLLKRAKEYGDYLIVGLSTDEFCLEKGKKTFYDYKKREEMLRAIKYVDDVIPETSFDQKFTDFGEYDVDVFVIGSDYKGSDKLLNIDKYCKLVILDRTPGVSTTQMKQIMK